LRDEKRLFLAGKAFCRRNRPFPSGLEAFSGARGVFPAAKDLEPLLIGLFPQEKGSSPDLEVFAAGKKGF
jgi:hypothetical protein